MVTDFTKASMDDLTTERQNLAKAIRANERDVEELEGLIDEQGAKLSRMKRSLSRKRRKAGAINSELRRRAPQQPHKSGERNQVLGEALSNLCTEIGKQRGVPASVVADEVLSQARKIIGVHKQEVDHDFTFSEK